MRRSGPAPAWLALEDGTVFEGRSFGAAVDAEGEVVFNTSMSGYQEILTDPSYKGQMVAMTVSHVGNYGVNDEDVESSRPHVEGFIVREACGAPSNWRSRGSLPDYLRRYGIPGIEGIDTRALVSILREKGALRAVLATRRRPRRALVERARSVTPIEGRDLVQEVSCRDFHEWREPVAAASGLRAEGTQMELGGAGDPPHLAVVDCGVKHNILRSLVSEGCRLTVTPARVTAKELLALSPDGVLFSNGPGDPERLPRICETAAALFGKLPVFGICLGHQIIGRALGARTFKLKFGHHGGNQPVRHEATGRVEITAQNHNFAVEAGSLPSAVEVTHVNLNDGTVEGLRHRELPIRSLQYHPEASPGPHDASVHFREFVDLMRPRGRT